MNVAEQFGKNLHRARRELDISQEELGFRASLNRTQIGILERGERVPRIDTLLKLATALEVSADRLLDGIRWRPGSATPGAFVASPNEFTSGEQS